jgi:hypothetical protein
MAGSGDGGGLVMRTERLRRVRLTPQEGRAAAQALGASGALGAVSCAPCTDIYLDRPGGTLARRAASVPAGATRVVLREWPGGVPLTLGLEVEQGGFLTTRTHAVAPAERQAALGPLGRERHGQLPEGVSPSLAVSLRRTVLVHREGWWVRLDEELQPWPLAAPGEPRNVARESVPALPLAILALHGSGPSVPAWLHQLACAGQRCPDLFGWEALLRPAPQGLRTHPAPRLKRPDASGPGGPAAPPQGA